MFSWMTKPNVAVWPRRSPGRRCERRGMYQLRDLTWLCWDHAPKYEMTTRHGELMQEGRSQDLDRLFNRKPSFLDP